MYALPVHLSFPMTPDERKTPQRNGECAARALQMVLTLSGLCHCDAARQLKDFVAVNPVAHPATIKMLPLNQGPRIKTGQDQDRTQESYC